MGLLDFVFPKYCLNCKKLGSYICSNCFSFISFDVQMICLVCNKGSIDGLTHPRCHGRYVIDGAFSAINYKGVVKKLIYNFKYKPYLADLKNILVDLFYESIIQNELFMRTIVKLLNYYIVPIPLHKNKLRSRGYNHAEILADGLSEKLGLQTLNILERVKETKSQFGLKLDQRKENIKGAFILVSPPGGLNTKYLPRGKAGKIHDTNVLLVDDILTTGSTMFEAAKILKRNGVKKVWGITLARD